MIAALAAVLRPLSRGEWVARLLLACLPTLALVLAGAAGARLPWWLVTAVVLLSLGWALFPESAIGLAALALVVLWWGVEIRDRLEPLVLPAAAAVLVAHVAAILVSYGPPGMRLDASVVRLWVRRGALLYLAVPVSYAFALAVEGRSAPALWPAALAATFAVIAAASVTLSLRRGYDASAAAAHGAAGLTGMLH